MPWDLFWIIIWQLVIACFILAFPLSVIGFFFSSAVTSGAIKKDRTSPSARPTNNGERVL